MNELKLELILEAKAYVYTVCKIQSASRFSPNRGYGQQQMLE